MLGICGEWHQKHRESETSKKETNTFIWRMKGETGGPRGDQRGLLWGRDLKDEWKLGAKLSFDWRGCGKVMWKYGTCQARRVARMWTILSSQAVTPSLASCMCHLCVWNTLQRQGEGHEQNSGMRLNKHSKQLQNQDSILWNLMRTSFKLSPFSAMVCKD